MGYLVTLHTHPVMAVQDVQELVRLVAQRIPTARVEIQEHAIFLAILLSDLPSREGWTTAEDNFFDGLKLLGFLVGWECKAMGIQ